MKISYGNYGMPEVPIWDALPRLARMGYEAVEICAADRWPTAPRKLSGSDRQRLKGMSEELGLELPALMLFVNMLAPEGKEVQAQERLLRDACALARDLSPSGARPVIASTLGHGADWEAALPLILERVARFGAVAKEEGCRLALEPHAGGLLDRPDKVLYLMERLHSPSLGINFDISHFDAGGYDRVETIRTLARYALHTHVKDGKTVDGKVLFQLPGEGGQDYEPYFREMARAGWTGPITVEVTAQIFNLPDYDPWPAAQSCLDTLRRARAAALGGDRP